jgi:hypothetical protein
MKDRKGAVCCPVLLSTECRYCYELGHTAKFCQELKIVNKLKEETYKRETARLKEIHMQRLDLKKAKVVEQPNSNRFYDLAESDSCSPKPTRPTTSRFANITLRKHQEDWHYDEYDDYDVTSELTDSDDDDDAIDARRQQMLDDEELIDMYLLDDGDCYRNR